MANDPFAGLTRIFDQFSELVDEMAKPRAKVPTAFDTQRFFVQNWGAQKQGFGVVVFQPESRSFSEPLPGLSPGTREEAQVLVTALNKLSVEELKPVMGKWLLK